MSTPSAAPALELRDLTVRFGHGRSAVTAVDRVSLTIEQGALLGLVGESGSGKSTLSRAVCGLVPHTAGEILLSGAPSSTRRARPGRPGPLQMVFQDPSSSLSPRLSIAQAIRDAIPRHRRRGRDRDAEVLRLLDLVSLHSAIADRVPAELSGGQRQRVAIARALAAEPEVLICDEITSALDVSVQGAILNLITELRTELDLSILFISHNLAVVRHISDDIAVMRHGRLVESGPSAEVLVHPSDPYTRTLLDAVPHPDSPITVDDAGDDFGFLADPSARSV
ncbi:ABC transporter ATP-binding protein [Microbacterium aerolatum]|uniref:ABC transporter ATP-binding protein n=1 Tax=Microbacterium aerolatum TaxID=153731 RepID=UPI00384BD40B